MSTPSRLNTLCDKSPSDLKVIPPAALILQHAILSKHYPFFLQQPQFLLAIHAGGRFLPVTLEAANILYCISIPPAAVKIIIWYGIA